MATGNELLAPLLPSNGEGTEAGAAGPEAGGPEPGSATVPPLLRASRASVRDLVASRPPFVLSFEDLGVHVPEDDGALFCRLPASLASFAARRLGWAVPDAPPLDLLRDCSGRVSSGEMLLVLSPDALRSAALLRAIAGRLGSDATATGTVRVDGAPLPLGSPGWSGVVAGWRRVAAHVAADDATHAPNLTVRETLRFAAECTRPPDGPEGGEREAAAAGDVVEEVLEMLDLTSCADTLVGDENLRGVSGGQKRRATVGEMLVARGTRLIVAESATDGLSSKDSFRIVAALGRACRTLQNAAVVSLNQPSDDVVKLFDHVLVLDAAGAPSYFGPPGPAALREAFGDDDTPPGTSLCDLCLGPRNDSAAIRERYLASAARARLRDELDEIRRGADGGADGGTPVEQLVPAAKAGAGGFARAFAVLGRRQALLVRRNPTTYMRVGVAAFFGIVVGSLFSVLGQDLPSSLARTAFMFQMQFLTLLLSTGITVPQNMRDRVTFYKHRSSEFYSSAAYYACQVLYGLPLSVLESILLTCITYFWVGMNPAAPRFFFFLGIMIVMECVGLALGRLFCAVSRTQVVAKSIVSLATLVFSTVASFMPKYNQIPPVLRWISWLSPPAYGFEALAINEYIGRELGLVTVARGGMDTTVGSASGEQWLDTLQIPRVEWASLQTIKVVNIFLLVLFAVVIDLLGLVLLERGRRDFFGKLRRPARTSGSLAFPSGAGGGEVADFEASEFRADPPAWPMHLTVSGISYFVPSKREAAGSHATIINKRRHWLTGAKGGAVAGETVMETKEPNELQLLTDVTATFKAGRATALMGTSGAGKTTLLDVIAGYKTGGRITGEVALDGLPKDTQSWRLMSGYAEQSDILNPYLTIVETLRFTACCRLPASVDRGAAIDRVVALVALEDWLDVVIGEEKFGEGIPKHVRKRVTIAVQLVTLPKILFLDEPTTGLGTSDANLVMAAIRRSTTEMNLITLVTIHQPSKLIWDMFDDLLLLAKGGKVAYSGEMGPESRTVLNHFAEVADRAPPEGSNPADFVISAVSQVTPDDAATAFQYSGARDQLRDALEEARGMDREVATAVMNQKRAELLKGKRWFMELRILTKRQLITLWRNPSYTVTRVICSLCLAIYFGILFGADKSTIEGAILTIGSTFFITFILVVPMQAAAIPLVADRAVLYRESTSGFYSRWTYDLSALLADIPFHVLNSVLMFLGFYYICGFQSEADRAGYFIVMMFLVNWAFTSIGQVYGVWGPNEEAANGLAGLTTILSVLFMGFLISYNKMPSYWKWANVSDILRYVIQGLTSNELGDNFYKLFPDGPPIGGGSAGSRFANNTLFGSIEGDMTELFLFRGNSDMTEGGIASQAATFLNMVIRATPSRNNNWNETWAGPVQEFIACGILNECFTKPVSAHFMSCFVLNRPRPAPCGNEFNGVVELVRNGKDAIDTCRNHTNISSSDTVLVDGPVLRDSSFTEDRAVLCILNALFPGGGLDVINEFLQPIVEKVTGISVLIVNLIDALSRGLPGEVILFLYGWAEFQDGELVAPWKWWYCLFSVFVFVAGLEFFKLIGTRFVVWTKR